MNIYTVSKILFTHSYFYRFDPKQWRNYQPYPPYGTIYAAALMRAQGHEVLLFDTNLKESPAEILPIIEKERPDYLVIYDDGFNYLTKMCLTNMREAAFEMSRYGKEHDCKVLVCSSDATDHYEKYLENGADFILQGEGELTLKELIEKLDQGNADLSLIAGISWKDGVKAVRNPGRPVLRQLDDLPDPAWDLVDIPAYRDIWMTHHGYFSLNIATTRGCPYKCNWCAKPIYGNRYNSRSPERVAGELELLVRQYGAQYFWVCDDIFGLKPGWVQRFREVLEEKNLKIQYKIQSRVDLLLQEDNIDALVASGLKQVWVGAESGSQKILDAMDKGTDVEQIYEATFLLKKKGVEVCFFLQFGYLGETQEDIDMTIRMVQDLVPHDIGISVSYPLPGTLFYEKVKDQLLQKQNWTHSDDLDLMFEGEFGKAYYKRLHRLVHKLFRERQGLESLKSLVAAPLSGNRRKWRSALLMLYYSPAALVDRVRLQWLAKR